MNKFWSEIIKQNLRKNIIFNRIVCIESLTFQSQSFTESLTFQGESFTESLTFQGESFNESLQQTFNKLLIVYPKIL